jgi:ASC-1-like (ASCH) protein
MEFRLDYIYFEMINKGEKCVEIRLNDEKRQALKVGDKLTFTCRGNLDRKIETEVTSLHHYKDFDEMLMYEPKKDIGFPFKSFEEIVEIYEEFYTKEEQSLYGVVAIKFKKL